MVLSEQPQLPASGELLAAVTVALSTGGADVLRRVRAGLCDELCAQGWDAEILQTCESMAALVLRLPDRRDPYDAGRMLRDWVRSALPGVEFAVGLGRSYAGPGAVTRTSREAVWAASVALATGGAGSVLSFRNLGVYRLLHRLAEHAGEDDLAELELLFEYDQVHGTDLVNTVATILETGRTLEAAARLHVHRNTIAYRVRVVRRVTGLDIRDPEARLLLAMQLRLATVRGVLPPPRPPSP